MDITIRDIQEDDVQAVSALSAQLGYSITVADTAKQISLIINSSNDVAYAAVDDGKVIAWIHVFYTLRLESQPFCEVGGLVVDEQYRDRGIGKLLLEKAKEWCGAKGCTRLVVRSNSKRNEAHQFYLKSGYKEVKEQKVFNLIISNAKTVMLIMAMVAAAAVHAQQYKYLALKGGGIRGIAYAGALKVLEEKHITEGITKVVGTSVGAITGALFCLGYRAGQIEEIMFEQDVAAFNDGEGYFIGGQRRLRKRYGWYKGQRMEQWIGGLVKAQTGSENTTFGQLHELAKKDKRYKDLYVTATNLTQQKLEIFSWESYPNMQLKTAIRASAAIPIYFAAVFIDSSGIAIKKPKKGGYYNVYVDGGLLANYPIGIFKDDGEQPNTVNEHTLGLKLDRPEQIAYAQRHDGIAPYDIHSFGSYIGALYNMIIEQLNKEVTPDEEKKHTIYISTSNLNPRVRHITREQKELLLRNGEEGAKRFFAGR